VVAYILGAVSVSTQGIKFAAVESGEVGRSAVHSRHNNDSESLPWGTPALTGGSSVYAVSIFTRKCLLSKQDFRTRIYHNSEGEKVSTCIRSPVCNILSNA
jgi:hypothetical protein